MAAKIKPEPKDSGGVKRAAQAMAAPATKPAAKKTAAANVKPAAAKTAKSKAK